MICTSLNCQKSIPDDAVYCPYCGDIIKRAKEREEPTNVYTGFETVALKKIPNQINGLYHISGVRGFNNQNLTIKFKDNQVIFFSPQPLRPPKIHTISKDEIKRVILFGETGTTVLQTDIGEIVIKGRIYRLANTLGQHLKVPFETKSEIKSPTRPIGVTILVTLGILINSVTLVVLSIQLIDSNFSQASVGSAVLLFPILALN